MENALAADFAFAGMSATRGEDPRELTPFKAQYVLEAHRTSTSARSTPTSPGSRRRPSTGWCAARSAWCLMVSPLTQAGEIVQAVP